MMRQSGSAVERRLFQVPLRPLHRARPPRLGFLYVLLCLSCCCCCFLVRGCRAQKLVQSEVDTLRLISDKLKMDLNFSVDPCSPNFSWIPSQGSNALITNNVSCTCNSDANGSTICHITSIVLKGTNLTGDLPDEFANLTFLSILDLTRNYLTGSIPTKWASLPLTQLTLLGNQISGRIPKELGSITTLQSLVLEDNLLQGSIPPELGQLANLSRLFLSANNLSGELPDSLGNLKNLTDFRIDGNPISGKIPNFIGNWTQLNRLDMQGTSMEGPFPPIFSTLTSITQLRVSDWKGGDGKFPALDNMTNMVELVLRNLSLTGELPDFIGNMSKLKDLDLSFNNLSGAIPSSYSALSKTIDFMYLTNNNLSGSIPSWILSNKNSIDVSYNSFTGLPAPSTCALGSVNLVSSYSSTESNSIETCLRRNLPCGGKAKNYKLFINCGGGKFTNGDDTYQDDTSPLGASIYSDRGDWAYSSTGDFVGNENLPYIVNNVSVLNVTNPELYMTARLSALSLKYYGFCLQKGNYTINLHFAEIILTNDQTFSSTGRRLFDVSIQGEKVLQDFNIAKEANGTGKAIIKSFTTLVDETLEIHFQWAGKGTNSIPQRGVYGPLISAISVTPNFRPKLDNNKLSAGAITGIVVGVCFVVGLALATLWFFFIMKGPQNDELKGLELHTSSFTLRQIRTATNHFDPENKIGEGGFGPVYKGVLPDGTAIAVKQLSSKSKQGNREFINEIGMISALQHPNLVKLYGCCIEGNQLLLIYEYMENNSLARALFGPEGQCLKLDWSTRRSICVGIARGLAYLHEESRIKIVHRDIKATNVLLDKDLNAKISDFGLAKLDEEENTHISTRVAGTIGYMAPEYAMRGYLTDKADVYSFGVVTMEIVSGMSNTNYRPKDEFVYLLDWAYVLHEQGNLLELVDKSLGSHYSMEEALQMLNLALLCTNPSPTLRPTMSAVVSMLEGKTPVRLPTVVRGTSGADDMRFRAFQMLSQDSQTQTGSLDGDGPWIDSSVSAQTSIDENYSHASKTKTTPDLTE